VSYTERPVTQVKRVPPPEERHLSDQLVALVRVVFALVIAQSLTSYQDIVTAPFSGKRWLATMAVIAVYVTATLSWIDWHVSMETNWYDVRNTKRGTKIAERLRVYADLVIVMLYAYLLFRIKSFETTPDANIFWFVFGFPLVFGMYVVSGLLRQAAHGAVASRPGVNIAFTVIFGVIAAFYSVVRDFLHASGSLQRLNAIWIVLLLVATAVYRLFRFWWKGIAARRSGLTPAGRRLSRLRRPPPRPLP